VDADSRLHEDPNPIKFDLLAELEKQADSLRRRVTSAEDARDAARRGEDFAKRIFCKAADRADAAEKQLEQAKRLSDEMAARAHSAEEKLSAVRNAFGFSQIEDTLTSMARTVAKLAEHVLRPEERP
jgi:predicted  nucleic acid-binding Zn-ribbon protein